MTNAGRPEATPPGASRRQALIAGLAVAAIGLHLLLRFGMERTDLLFGLRLDELPMLAALLFGGGPLVLELGVKLLRREAEGTSFVRHLRPRHHLERVLLVSGDRESEVRYLADQVGIHEVYAGQTPEQKLEIVRRETEQANTVYLGDGINDAPALTAATVGLAFGPNSDVTAEAAGAVILETSLRKVDEFLHVSRRLRTIALQSAVGGMALSLAGMAAAAAGYLPPVAGAVLQEVIDVLAVVNALRVALPRRTLTDYEAGA